VADEEGDAKEDFEALRLERIRVVPNAMTTKQAPTIKPIW
jgi:hypothetical protein